MSGDVLNPADIESRMQEISRRIHAGVKVVTDAESEAREKRRLYDLVFAQACLDYDGAAYAKKWAAEVATTDARAAAETAEIAFRYAERTARALEKELAATQSIGASVRSMYAGEKGFGG